MSLNKAIITIAEADAALALETEWLALTDEIKTFHVARASVHVQLNWTCTDVDWDDDTTITSEQKEATAYYALASYNGNLYVDPKDEQIAKGKLKEETSKLGSLVDTLKWYEGSSNSGYPLQYPDSLMGFECAYKGATSGSVKTVRV